MRKLIVALLLAAICIAAPAVALDWDALPTNMMVIIDGDYPPGDMCGTYFDVYLYENDVVAETAVVYPGTAYPGWCVETGVYSIKDVPYYACLSSTIGVSSDWNKVNWILNNKGDATWSEIQAAIWKTLGQDDPFGWYNAVAEELYTNADASYIPMCGDIGAVLVEVCDATSIDCCIQETGQTVIIEVPLEPCPTSVPEFPAMMIPVFLVGSVLVAASILKRE